jgi:polyhydroxyalkanoate synthesis regulator phasin
MDTKDTKQIKKRLKALENEVARLQKLVDRGDPEGEYKEEFVQDILDRAEDEPAGEIKDSEHFRELLADVRE